MLKLENNLKFRLIPVIQRHRWFLLPAIVALAPVNVLGQTPDIRISGASPALEENIRAHIDILDERCDSQIRRLNRLLPQLRRDIERAAQAIGYYRLTQRIEFAAGEPCWTASIAVQPGDPVRFGDLNIDIDTPPENNSLFRDILAESPVVSGARLNHSLYEQLKSQLSSGAIENGFFAARFIAAELAIDLSRNVADVTLAFETGERFRFGEIQITPVAELSDDFIARFIAIDEDTPYSTETLVEMRQNLNESQYFNQVTVTPLLSQAQDQAIPVNVELSMRPRHSYTAGVGVTTDNGPRVRFAYEDRYINRRGHRLNADVVLSPMQQEPNISYIIPMRNPAYDSLRFTGGYLGQETDSYISSTFRLGTTYRSRVWDSWIQNIFVNFQREDFEINDLDEETDSTVVGINWARTKSDDPIFPTRGWRLFTQVSGASEKMLSNISFVQLYGSAKWVESFGPIRTLMRVETATTVVDEIEELPASLRFFTGGDTSVRGYQYGAIGALNELGEVIGGKHLLAASAEVDFEVRPGWRGAVFYDVGNSFADFGEMNLQTSVGLGARWLSPIGPIRVDVARGLEDGSFRLHVTMGPDL